MLLLAMLTCYLLFASSVLHASEQWRLLSWNLNNMMSKETFLLWQQKCSKTNWGKIKSIKTRDRLVYCDAHNGKMFGSDQQAYLVLHDWASFNKKVQSMKEIIVAFNADIYALQEISDINALSLIFDEQDYKLWATDYDIAHNLGFAVSNSLNAEISVQTIDEFAIFDGNYRARPALQLTIKTKDYYFRILNLHLKSGCKNYIIDKPLLAKGTDTRSLSEIVDDCQIFRKQIPVLRNWIVKQNNLQIPFILAGDFNRLLYWELNEFYTRGKSSRLPGSDSLDNRAPITENTKIAYLYPEINISKLNAGKLWIAVPELKVKKYLNKPRCSYGNNYFIYNKRLLTMFGLDYSVSLLSSSQDLGDKYYGVDKALPSDHCPIDFNIEPFQN